MKIMSAALLSALALCALEFAANAQVSYRSFGINQTQARLNSRINQGMRNGSLSSGEAARLRAKLNRIKLLEARFRVNGLSTYERSTLNTQLQRLSNEIDLQMQDFQRRRGGFRGYESDNDSNNTNNGNKSDKNNTTGDTAEAKTVSRPMQLPKEYIIYEI